MAQEGYYGFDCPKCLTWSVDVSACPHCGHPIPLAYIFLYDDPPWEFSEELIAKFRGYRALRLLAKYAGRSPERLAELRQCLRLYLSRYRGFEFAFLRSFDALEVLELDYAPILDVDGVQHLKSLAVLKFMECRELERIDALAECASLKLLQIALCNRVTDYAPIGGIGSLQQLVLHARTVESLEFLRPLRNLHSLTLGVDQLTTHDLDPLFDLVHLESLDLKKKLAKPKDVARIRERLPNVEVNVL